MKSAQLALVVLLNAAICFAWVVWGGVFMDSDGRAIYAATLAVANGFSPWDEAAQSVLMTAVTGEPRTVLPFGYPPWYVLTTLPLGWLPYPQAERLFTVYNLAWLAVGARALTADSDPRKELWLVLAAALYLPAISVVGIGQMTMPVFAGIGLALYAWPRKLPWLLAFAALLMSFKWHIGAVPALAFLVLLLRDRELFRRTALPLVAVFAIPALLGLFLDPRWPLTYARSVLELSTADVNTVCDSCSSLAWTVSTRSPVPTSVAGLVLLLAGVGAITWRGLVRDPRAFVTAVVLLTPICLPYVRNYDYAIVSVAIAVLFERCRNHGERALVGLCWLLPLLFLNILPRTLSDELLGGSALAMLILLLVQGPSDGAGSTHG